MPQNVPANLAVATITLYQRYVSPYKGFRCAFHAHHGGLSCSEYGKQMIHEHGLADGISLIFRRFHECAASARVLRFATQPGPDGRRDSNPFDASGCPCGTCDVACDVASCWF